MAKHKACSECCEPINTRAKRCPHCTAKQRRKDHAGSLLVGFFVLAAIGAAQSPDTVSHAQSTPRRHQPSQKHHSVTSHREASQASEFTVPTDPRARYTFLVIEGTASRPIVTTKRVGPSGTSFSKKEFDCSSRTFRYLGDGNTLEQMQRSAPSPQMGPLVQGSISDYHWRRVCRL